MHKAAAIMRARTIPPVGDGDNEAAEEKRSSETKALIDTVSEQAPYEKTMLLSVNPDQETLALLRKQGLQAGKSFSFRHLGMTITTFTVPSGQDAALNLIRLRDIGIDVVNLNHYYTLEAGSEQNPSPLSVQDTASYPWPLPRAHGSGQDISVGMVDGQVDIHQSWLRNQKIIRKSFTHGSSRLRSDHGTTIAKLLVGHPSSRFSGLIPKARLYAASAFAGQNQKKPQATLLAILQSLDWLMEQHVQVINLSFSGPDNSLLHLAIHNIISRNIPVVAAAGNHGPQGPPAYPGAYEGVIAITAIDRYLRPYRHANRGRYISFAGPGVRLPIPEKNGRISYKSGTSFAAPYYTALIAAILSQKPHIQSVKEIVPALTRCVVDLGEPGRDPVYGWGLVKSTAGCELPLLSRF